MTKMCNFFIYILLNSMTENVYYWLCFLRLCEYFFVKNSSYISGEHDKDISY